MRNLKLSLLRCVLRYYFALKPVSWSEDSKILVKLAVYMSPQADAARESEEARLAEEAAAREAEEARVAEERRKQEEEEARLAGVWHPSSFDISLGTSRAVLEPNCLCL